MMYDDHRPIGRPIDHRPIGRPIDHRPIGRPIDHRPIGIRMKWKELNKTFIMISKIEKKTFGLHRLLIYILAL